MIGYGLLEELKDGMNMWIQHVDTTCGYDKLNNQEICGGAMTKRC